MADEYLASVDAQLAACKGWLDQQAKPAENPWKRLYERMRECAAGYSNCCDECGSTRKLEREFTAIEEDARALSK